jgi:hypothetical protein
MDSQPCLRSQIFSGQPLKDQDTMWTLEKQTQLAEATTASELNCLLIETKKSLLLLQESLKRKLPEDKLQPPQPQPLLPQQTQQSPQPLLPQQTQQSPQPQKPTKPSKTFSVPRVVSASACGKKPKPKPKPKVNPRVVSAGIGKTCPVAGCGANLSMWTDHFNTFCRSCAQKKRRWR